MILKKRISLAIISLTVFVFSIALGVVLSVILPVNATPNDRPIIIIDAGHGGLTNTIMAIFFETVQPHCFGAKS